MESGRNAEPTQDEYWGGFIAGVTSDELAECRSVEGIETWMPVRPTKSRSGWML